MQSGNSRSGRNLGAVEADATGEHAADASGELREQQMKRTHREQQLKRDARKRGAAVSADRCGRNPGAAAPVCTDSCPAPDYSCRRSKGKYIAERAKRLVTILMCVTEVGYSGDRTRLVTRDLSTELNLEL